MSDVTDTEAEQLESTEVDQAESAETSEIGEERDAAPRSASEL